jgi:uncharacterized protein
VASIDVDSLAAELSVGPFALKDILDAIARPGRDPREDLPQPMFRREILRLEDLRPGMKLSGTVLNVVDFGAFVDIGIVDSGLVHVSRLADRFIRDPHEVVSVGDLLDVWVVDVDHQRRRVSLTAIEPGTERPRPPRRPPKQAAQPAESAPAARAQPAVRPTEPAQQPQPARRPRRESHGKRDVRKKQPHLPKPRPRPVVPITQEMREGRAPLRTFSDLKQFFEQRVEQVEPQPPDQDNNAQS